MFLKRKASAKPNNTETGWLIFGANGQVSRALQAELAERDAVTVLSRHEADFSNPKQLAEVLETMQPSALMNASAYTAVDQAEQEEDRATIINGESVGVLARYAAARNIPLVHFSTDYVFDGSGEQPRHEDAPTAPLSAYGRSKLAGEQAITESGCKHLIFRTSWVYDADGKNFVNTMLKLGRERDELSIIADQIGAPSYAPHLAKAAIGCLDKALAMEHFPSGIYHMCNAGETSWHGFAEAIFEQARAHGSTLRVHTLNAIATSQYPTPATRPLNSRLSCSKLNTVFGVNLPSWQKALSDCFEAKNYTFLK